MKPGAVKTKLSKEGEIEFPQWAGETFYVSRHPFTYEYVRARRHGSKTTCVWAARFFVPRVVKRTARKKMTHLHGGPPKGKASILAAFLGDEIWTLVQRDQGFWFISDGITSLADPRKVFGVVRGALKYTEKAARTMRNWLMLHGEL